MDKTNIENKIENLFNIVRLHSWCSQIEKALTEIKEIDDPEEKTFITELATDKIKEKDAQREESILAIVLLYIFSSKFGTITDVLFNNIRDKLFMTDFNFLMKHLFQNKSPIPKELTHDLSEKSFIDIKDAIKRALTYEKIVSEIEIEKTMVYFILLLCRPELNEENKAMMYVLLSKIQAEKPPNLELEIINFFKKYIVTDDTIENVEERNRALIEVEEDTQNFDYRSDIQKQPKKQSGKKEKKANNNNIANVLNKILTNKKKEKEKEKYKAKEKKEIENIIKELQKKIKIEKKEEKKESKYNKKTQKNEQKRLNKKNHILDIKDQLQEKIKNITKKKPARELEERGSKELFTLKSTEANITSEENKPKKEKKSGPSIFEIYFGPLGDILKGFIDNLMSMTPKEIKKRNKHSKQKDKEENKIEIKIQWKKLKYLLLIPIALFIIFLISKINFDDNNKETIVHKIVKENTPIKKNEQKIEQVIKDTKKNKTTTSKKINNDNKDFTFEKIGNNVFWKIKRSNSIWNLFVYSQTYEIPYEANINRKKYWHPFYNTIKKLNPDRKNFDILEIGEKIRIK